MDTNKIKKQLNRCKDRYKRQQQAWINQQETYNSMIDDNAGNKAAERQLKRVNKQKEKLSEVESEYAKSVFNYLSESKPGLIVRKTKEAIAWDIAYPSSFDALSEDQITSIVALAEEDGGRYRVNTADYPHVAQVLGLEAVSK